jgi:23S rRNA pseudouridine1911/1915/1917 synthase
MNILQQQDITLEGVGYFIVFENEDFVIINKRYGLAVQATDTDQIDLETILNKRYKTPIYVINRIDMPVSGLVIFGKNKEFTKAMTEQLKSRSIEKIYLTIVKGQPVKGAPQTIKHFLKKLHNRAMTADLQVDDNYKEAILTYEWMYSFDNYELLKIHLHTGRFHQIRAQMATIEMPIKGDLKYGSRRPNLDRSICLVSYKLSFTHPMTGEKFTFKAPLPTNETMWGDIPANLLSDL